MNITMSRDENKAKHASRQLILKFDGQTNVLNYNVKTKVKDNKMHKTKSSESSTDNRQQKSASYTKDLSSYCKLPKIISEYGSKKRITILERKNHLSTSQESSKHQSHSLKKESKEKYSSSSKSKSSSHSTRKKDEKSSKRKHKDKDSKSRESEPIAKRMKSSDSPEKSKKSRYYTNKDLSKEISSLRNEHKKIIEKTFEKYMSETKKAMQKICQETIRSKHRTYPKPINYIIPLDLQEVLTNVKSKSDDFYYPKKDLKEKESTIDPIEEQLKDIFGSNEKEDDIICILSSDDEEVTKNIEYARKSAPVAIKQEKNCNEEQNEKPLDLFTNLKPISQIKTELGLKKEKIPGIDISDEFKNLSKNVININCWIFSFKKHYTFKEKKVFDSMLTENCQFSLFKCLAAKCNYSTISCDNFLSHLNAHFQSNYFIKDYYLCCPYCPYEADKPDTLIKHYKEEHFQCIYQCNLCFYRSAEAQSVYDHQRIQHQIELSKCEILECPRVFNRADNNEEDRANRRINISKDELTISCNFCENRFIIPEDFTKHLSNDHKTEAQTKRAKELLDKMNKRLINNKIGKYQCIECPINDPFGTNNRIEMRTHMQKHPNRQHYTCVRQQDKFLAQKITSRKDITLKLYVGDLEILRNYDDVNKTCLDV